MGSWPSARDDRYSPSYTTLNDDQLVGLLGRRDGRALEALYDRYSRLAYSVALRVLADQARAEEVVQDAYLKLWRQPELFDAARGRFQPWFLQLVRNRALDGIRATQRERTQRIDDPEGEVWSSLPDTRPEPDELVVATLDRERVLAALAQLPAAQREAIDLAYFGGLTQAEIALRLGEPLGTVKTRVRLGMRRLRDLLAGPEQSAHSGGPSPHGK